MVRAKHRDLWLTILILIGHTQKLSAMPNTPLNIYLRQVGQQHRRLRVSRRQSLTRIEQIVSRKMVLWPTNAYWRVTVNLQLERSVLWYGTAILCCLQPRCKLHFGLQLLGVELIELEKLLRFCFLPRNCIEFDFLYQLADVRVSRVFELIRQPLSLQFKVYLRQHWQFRNRALSFLNFVAGGW